MSENSTQHVEVAAEQGVLILTLLDRELRDERQCAAIRQEFLAAVQVIVYAGAILIFYLFVVMLLDLRDELLGGPALLEHRRVGRDREQVLRERARPLSVKEIRSESIQLLIEFMRETMQDAPGVGLAAP